MDANKRKKLSRKSLKGQGLIEYLVLTCLVAVAAISVVSVVGRNIREQYANISRALTKGESQAVTFSEVQSKDLDAKGLNNYMENSHAPK